MPDRVTEADLARWEALAADTADVLDDYAIDLQHDVAMNDLRGLSRTAVPALVNEVRRLQQFIEIAALALEDTGHRTGAEALRRGVLTHSLMKPADA